MGERGSNDMKNIKFQILSSSKAYDDEEKILVKEDDDKVMVTIAVKGCGRRAK